MQSAFWIISSLLQGLARGRVSERGRGKGEEAAGEGEGQPSHWRTDKKTDGCKWKLSRCWCAPFLFPLTTEVCADDVKASLQACNHSLPKVNTACGEARSQIPRMTLQSVRERPYISVRIAEYVHAFFFSNYNYFSSSSSCILLLKAPEEVANEIQEVTESLAS